MNGKQLIFLLFFCVFFFSIPPLIAIGFDARQDVFDASDSPDWDDQESETFLRAETEHYQEPTLLHGIPAEYTTRIRKRQKRGYVGQAIGETISSAFKDIFVLHKNLFTWNTFKVVSTTLPLFAGARMIDEKLQRCFYEKKDHKNINQMPSWCHNAAKISIAIPIVLLGLDTFFSRDDDRRWTSQILLIGMPFVIWTKKLVKQMKFDACLRPWNEKFSRCKRSFGGFPSGHMAQALYMAVLYGTRYGPRFAVPLGLLASFIGVTFISCNRHYVSQVIAGAAFGTIYALAASKLVDEKLAKQVKLGFGVDQAGRPNIAVGVSW